MRIQVTLDSATGMLTVHAEGCTAATPPARLAATLAGIVEATLTEPAISRSALPRRSAAAGRPAGHRVGLRHRPGRGRRAAAGAEDPTRAATVAPAVPLVVTEPADTDADNQPDSELATAPVADVAVAAAAPAEDHHKQDEQEGPRRREALQLLDAGVPDHEICAKLGISRSRLLRWDDPDGEFRTLTESLAGVSA